MENKKEDCSSYKFKEYLNELRVLKDTLPRLKNEILNRDGRVVIRPDSGNPCDIICGAETITPNTENKDEIKKGVVELLWDIFGGTINSKGYKVLDTHIGCIYGDAITLERADEICKRLEAKGFASSNIVFGIGSYTYNMNSRDTFGFALKSTYAIKDGKEIFLFKNPITDNGEKKSQKGMVSVFRDEMYDEIMYKDGYYQKDKEDSLRRANLNLDYPNDSEHYEMLLPLFENGKILRETSLNEIRNKLCNAYMNYSTK